MIKVAILGSENSHAWHFAAALKGKDGSRLFDDVDLIGVYGDTSTEDGRKGNDEIAKVSACTRFATHYEDFLNETDAVMVTARHGGKHFQYARDYIKKGIPVWIDKPITGSTEEAVKLASLVKACHAPVCGGSSLVHTDAIRSLSAYVKENRSSIIGGHVTAPVSMENDYGGFWFYSQHLIQMMTEVFGTDVISVTAQKESQGVRAVYRYAQFCVTAFFGTGYTISLYRGGYDAVSATITLGEDYFLPELHAFYKMVKTGRIADRLQDLIAPVFLIDATITAYEKNREVYVHIPNV